MADPREDYGNGAIVLDSPDAPVPQPKIVMPDGSIVTPEELAEIEAIEDDAELRDAYEATGEVEEDDAD